MCGITGYLRLDKQKAIESDGWRMVNTLNHRGPDYQQIWLENNVILCHARLSILDISSAGNQPMFSDDGMIVIVYNGEIYNFQELKKELIEAGFHFHTGTDTEVIIKGFQLWNTEVFKKLNGIFAFALWNKRDKKFYLVRDRFGVKPLYIGKADQTIYFASEIKAILTSGQFSPQISYTALHEFIYYGNTLDSKTLFNNISKLDPGKFLKIDGDSITEHTYWHPGNIPLLNHISESEAVGNVRQKLDNAVKRQLVSDVPVGIFLSGGIDSSCITAFASKYYSGKLNTYSAAFDFDMGINELEKANKISRHFNTNHHELFIKGENLAEIIYQLVSQHDEPFSDAANIPLFMMTKYLNGNPKVILQGDGGDEIFAGYRRYNILDNINKWKLAVSPLMLANNIFNNQFKREQYKRFLKAIDQKDDAMKMALLITTYFSAMSFVYSKKSLRQT